MVQIMEDMEIDDVVIPDTPPDRLAARRGIYRESVGKLGSSPSASNLNSSDFADEKSGNSPRVKDRYVYENGCSRRLVIQSPRNSSNLTTKTGSDSYVLSSADEKSGNSPRVKDRYVYENGCSRRLVIRSPRNSSNLTTKTGSDSYVLSSGDNSSSSQNIHLFRRPAVGRNSSSEAKLLPGTENLDKGKSISIKSSSRSFGFPENTEVLDLTEHNGHTQVRKKFFPHGNSNDVAEGTKNWQIASVGSSTDCTERPSERSRYANKAKEKIDNSRYNGLGLAVSVEKRGGLPNEPHCKPEHQNPMALHSFTLPKVSGQKRLVRNGCISPHNIATRSKQVDVDHYSSSKNMEHSKAVNPVFKSSPSIIDVSDIVIEDNKMERVKGKGVMVQSSTPKENCTRFDHTSTSLVSDNNNANRTSHVDRDISGCSEKISGWRSTRNRSSVFNPLLNDSNEDLPRTFNGVGNFVNEHGFNVEREDFGREGDCVRLADNLNSIPTASRLASKSGRLTGQYREGKRVMKREKKRGLNVGNHSECSTLDNGDSDIQLLGSSKTFERPKSSRIQRPQSQEMLRPVIEVDELSPMAGPSIPQGVDSRSDDLEARARQLEADEMLARELQEQLYHEVPAFGGGELIDEHLAWALQHEENNSSASSSGRHNIPNRRGSATLASHRLPQSWSFQNPSTRRGMEARVPSSSTMAQLRNRLRNQAPGVSNRRRNMRVPFPSDMDLDRRLNILEALEAAVGDVGDVGLNNHMLHLQRDFTANDYEMLLALDENNHQLGGATVNQLNSLPQSTVQTDASEEACAICLETPTLGETVRHLPCLHRFHKDCIDPWLNRKTLCPVCKCSIS